MALKHIKVVELAGLAPAPFCGMILADFGASVLRIDKVGYNPIEDCLGNGKKSIALNLKHPKGVQILKDICKKSDVLIEPFRPGVMESLGLGPDILMKENKRLIYSRLTGFGQSGPLKNRAGHDINYLALSGLLSLFGRYQEKPLFPVNLAADFGGGGLMCALGIVLALFERSQSEMGQIVDANMVHGTAYLGSWLYRSQSMFIWGNERGRNILDTGTHFYEVYETKDGKYMSVGSIEKEFYKKLLKGLGLTSEEAPQAGDFEELKELLAKKFLEKTQIEWTQIFEEMDACVMPVLPLDEAPFHPHNKDNFTKDKENNTYVPKPAPVLSRTPGISAGHRKLPKIGEHTKEILTNLKYSDEQISQLEVENVVGIYRNNKL